MTLFLVIGLVIISGLFSLLPGAVDLFSAIMSIPDAFTMSDLERKARAGR